MIAEKQFAPHARTIPHLRWYICGLLFFATTVNYIDRQVLGILKPVLEKQMNWSEADFGWMLSAFNAAYALMMPLAGRLMDWIGTRLGYAWAVLLWTVAAMAHSLAGTAMQFSIARFCLGIGEAANFPAAIKTVADWFPKRERALATGIFNSGSNVGAILAPLMVPYLAATFGWRSAFLVTGSLGFLWIVAWLALFYQPAEHKRLSAEERQLIASDREEDAPRKVKYAKLLGKRAAWAFLAGKFLTDPIWWFYLYWTPGFLNRQYGLDLTQLGPPLIVIYLLADAGSVGGGWLSSALLKRGWSLTAARKTAMFVCAVAVAPVSMLMFTGGHVWLAVALISLAASAHQGWSANLFTLTSDVFPRSAVGSVVGLGGFGGAIGGMLVSPLIGYWLDFSHGAYGPLFVIAGLMYLLAWGVMHLLLPKLEPVEI
ncbi:MAG: MFS transporter [Bryobacterales bacterium]|nr:MFS transporter [Bryobacterales bacterium]